MARDLAELEQEVRRMGQQVVDLANRLNEVVASPVTYGPITGQVDVGDAAFDGSLASVARSDHQHAFPAPQHSALAGLASGDPHPQYLLESGIKTASIAFLDGDTLRRVTVADANVTAASVILGAVIRPSTGSDAEDPGYVYTANVVRRTAGAFDLLVACLGWGFDDPAALPPNETITFAYIVL